MRSFRFIFPYLLLIFASCGSSSLEEFKEEGRALTEALTGTLQRIHTRDELIKEIPRIKKLYNELVDVIIAASEYREKEAVDFPELLAKDHIASDRLRTQLIRLYAIENCRELIEKCQEEALNKLDGYKKRLAKQRELLSPI